MPIGKIEKVFYFMYVMFINMFNAEGTSGSKKYIKIIEKQINSKPKKLYIYQCLSVLC